MTLEVEANDSETARTTETLKVPDLACVSWARPDGSAGLYHWADPHCKQHVVRALDDIRYSIRCARELLGFE